MLSFQQFALLNWSFLNFIDVKIRNPQGLLKNDLLKTEK